MADQRQEARTQESLVAEQFGARAEAYLISAVHAGGEDLRALGALAAGHPGARVLDLGCGGGHVAFTVAPHVSEVVACDLSPAMLAVVADAALARGLHNIITQQGAAELLPFADASFDLVLSRFSAHHWRDLDLGLREAARVLAPAGAAVFIDVVSPGRPVLDTHLQAIEVLRDPSHVRDYSRAEWEAALARAGLDSDAASVHRLRMEFPGWVARTATPATQIAAIRSLQSLASDTVQQHFAIAEDGSFTLDVLTMHASKPSTTPR